MEKKIWIRGSGMKILDHFSESLETVFGLNILKFFDADPDPESLCSGIRDGKIPIRDPGLT
jgi:hypothetical protein